MARTTTNHEARSFRNGIASVKAEMVAISCKCGGSFYDRATGGHSIVLGQTTYIVCDFCGLELHESLWGRDTRKASLAY